MSADLDGVIKILQTLQTEETVLNNATQTKLCLGGCLAKTDKAQKMTQEEHEEEFKFKID